MQASVKSLKKDIGIIRTSNHLSKELIKEIQTHEKFLMSMREYMESMDETVGGILLAIRQNEYLQAWYPEQQGLPAMKCVGKHPVKLAKSSNKK